MNILGMILIIFIVLSLLCVLAAVVFFFGPTVILMVADLAEIFEAKKQEWLELIKAGKGEE